MFYVSDISGDLITVTDTDDGVAEVYSRADIGDLTYDKSVYIHGVTQRGIKKVSKESALANYNGDLLGVAPYNRILYVGAGFYTLGTKMTNSKTCMLGHIIYPSEVLRNLSNGYSLAHRVLVSDFNSNDYSYMFTEVKRQTTKSLSTDSKTYIRGDDVLLIGNSTIFIKDADIKCDESSLQGNYVKFIPTEMRKAYDYFCVQRIYHSADNELKFLLLNVSMYNGGFSYRLYTLTDFLDKLKTRKINVINLSVVDNVIEYEGLDGHIRIDLDRYYNCRNRVMGRTERVMASREKLINGVSVQLYSNGELEKLSLNKSNKSLVIPEETKVIRRHALDMCSSLINRVVIPENIQKVHKECMINRCNATDYKLPDGTFHYINVELRNSREEVVYKLLGAIYSRYITIDLQKSSPESVLAFYLGSFIQLVQNHWGIDQMNTVLEPLKGVSEGYFDITTLYKYVKRCFKSKLKELSFLDKPVSYRTVYITPSWLERNPEGILERSSLNKVYPSVLIFIKFLENTMHIWEHSAYANDIGSWYSLAKNKLYSAMKSIERSDAMYHSGRR